MAGSFVVLFHRGHLIYYLIQYLDSPILGRVNATAIVMSVTVGTWQSPPHTPGGRGLSPFNKFTLFITAGYIPVLIVYGFQSFIKRTVYTWLSLQGHLYKMDTFVKWTPRGNYKMDISLRQKLVDPIRYIYLF